MGSVFSTHSSRPEEGEKGTTCGRGKLGQGGLLGWRREGPIAAGTAGRRGACLQGLPAACPHPAKLITARPSATGLVCADEECAALGAGRLRQELVDQPEELLHHRILAQVVVAALDLCSDVGKGAQGGLVGRQLGGWERRAGNCNPQMRATWFHQERPAHQLAVRGPLRVGDRHDLGLVDAAHKPGCGKERVVMGEG